jgi:hypothetical protein
VKVEELMGERARERERKIAFMHMLIVRAANETLQQ